MYTHKSSHVHKAYLQVLTDGKLVLILKYEFFLNKYELVLKIASFPENLIHHLK